MIEPRHRKTICRIARRSRGGKVRQAPRYRGRYRVPAYTVGGFRPLRLRIWRFLIAEPRDRSLETRGCCFVNCVALDRVVPNGHGAEAKLMTEALLQASRVTNLARSTPQSIPGTFLIPLRSRLEISRTRRQMLFHHIFIKCHAESRSVRHVDPSVIHDRRLHSLFDQR